MTPLLLVLAAQDFGAQAGIDLGSSMMSVATMNSAIGAGVSRGGASVRPRRLPDRTFHPGPAVTERVKRQYLAFLARSVSPQASQDMAKFLAQFDFKKAWTRQEASDGLRPDNVADAMVAYFALNWCIANDKPGFTPASAQALKRQFAPVILGQPAFRRMGNDGRQEMAEVWMVNFVAQAAGYESARKSGDAAMLHKLQDAAAARFKNEAHLDLRALRLTDAGFVRG